MEKFTYRQNVTVFGPKPKPIEYYLGIKIEEILLMICSKCICILWIKHPLKWMY